MSFKSVAAKNAFLRIIGAMTVAAAALFSVIVTSQSAIHAQSAQRAAPPKIRLPEETAGIDGIVGALISVYDQFDVVALGEAHGRRLDSDLRIAWSVIRTLRKKCGPSWWSGAALRNRRLLTATFEVRTYQRPSSSRCGRN